MTIQVQSADGVIHQFPDGTNPAVIDGAMKAYVQQHKPQGPGQQITGFMANLNRGTGLGDELVAGANAAGSLAGDFLSGRRSLDPKDPQGSLRNAEATQYAASLARQRGVESGYQAQHPHMAALAQGTGMAATVAVPVGDTANVFANGSRLGNMARGAVMGGANAAAYAAADAGTPAERLQAASRGATNPFALGLGAVGGALATPGAPRAQPLSRDQLAAAKDAAYGQVDGSNVTYSPEAFQNLTSNMGSAMDDAGFHAGLHPKAAAMADRLGKSAAGVPGGYSPTLTQVDQLRQQIGRDVASSHDAGDARMGQIMRGQVDNFINKAGPADLIAGDISPGDAADLIQTARGLNTRLAKVDAINEAAGLADRRAAKTGSGGNIDNAMRQNMDKLLSSVQNWSPAEREALDNIVMGGRGQNLLRLVGKLSPGGNGLSMMLNLGATGAGGAAAGAPGALAGATPAITGMFAKLAADGITRAKVAKLVAEISTLPGATAPAEAAMSGQAAARAARAAGVGAAASASPRNVFAQPANP